MCDINIMESDLNNILHETDVYSPDTSLCHSFFLFFFKMRLVMSSKAVSHI